MPEKPFAIVPVRPDDEPTVCVPINTDWIGWLIGMLYPYRYPEHWLGTLEENRQARQDVMTLLDILIDARDCAMAGCCDGSDLIITVLHRVDPSDGSTLQASIDGGTTWVQDPKDPRAQIVIPAPNPSVVSGGKTRCDRAENIVQFLQAWVADTANKTGTVLEIIAGIIATLLALLLLPEGIGGGLALFISAIAQAVKTLGHDAFLGLFTTEIWDAVRCAAYCSMDANGNMSKSQFLQFYQRVANNIPDGSGILGARQNLLFMIASMGYPGALLAAHIGTSDGADCSACDCSCHGDANFMLAALPILLNEVHGTWQSGLGWKNTELLPGVYYFSRVDIPVLGCGHIYIEIRFFAGNVPFDHATLLVTYKNLDSGQIVVDGSYNNVNSQAGENIAIMQSPAGNIEVQSISFTLDTQQPGTGWIERIRWNETGVFG